MNAFLLGLALFLMVNLTLGLLRVVRGPTPADRMVAGQLFGTTGVAVLLVLGQATGEAALADVALVFALLAVVVSVAFVKRGWVRTMDAQPDDAGGGGPEQGAGDGEEAS